MQLNRCGITARLSSEPLRLHSQCHVLTLAFLRRALARLVCLGVELTRVCTPMVGIMARAPKGLWQRFQLQKALLLTTPNHLGSHLTTTVRDRMSVPSRLFLALDARPDVIDFCRVCEAHQHLSKVASAWHSPR